MDDNGHRENGRHKADHYKAAQSQWLMHPQPSMKQIMGIMVERDAVIQERNLAMSEKKAALAERDMAILQRDMAIAERNNALLERDNAIATLQFRENSVSSSSLSCPPGCQIARGIRHMHHPQQHSHNVLSHVHELHRIDAVPEPTKAKRIKSATETKPISGNKKASKPSRKAKREGDHLNKAMFGKPDEWKNENHVGSESDWKVQDLGLNQVAFDESTMPVPMCSCTSIPRQCYKWGNGGWQSACCTTTVSMHPLPPVPNKRHARVGGRKMSGSAFNKLISRLAAQGHDLSAPVNLHNHWAKHGTNRNITIK